MILRSMLRKLLEIMIKNKFETEAKNFPQFRKTDPFDSQITNQVDNDPLEL